MLRAAGAGPGGRGHLEDDSVAVAVPGQESLGVSRGGRLGWHWVAIELVVPDHVKGIAVIDLVEGGAEGIGHRAPDAAASLGKGGVGAAGVNELLAGRRVGLRFPTERTGALDLGAAIG